MALSQPVFTLFITFGSVLLRIGNEAAKDEKIWQVARNPCDISIAGNNTLVDCSWRSLTFVLKSWFPENTTEILLQGNQLAVVPNCTIDDLYELKRLSLQENRLTYIEPAAFQGLVNLLYLNLEDNQLDLFSLSVNIFRDLINLNELRLIQKDSVYNGNSVNRGPGNGSFPSSNGSFPSSNGSFPSSNGSFPDQMFGYLKNLTSLTASVAGELLLFNTDFFELTKLTTLEIAGTVGAVARDSFRNVRHVRNFKMSNFHNIVNFSDSALDSFDKLDSINFEDVEIGLHSTLRLLCPLVNTDVQYLRIMRVQLQPNLKFVSILTKDGILDRDSTQYLRGICVEELRLEQCAIFVILLEALRSPVLDKCLKRLYILNNPVIGTTMALGEILTKTSLHTLVIWSTFGSELDLGKYKMMAGKFQDGLLVENVHLATLDSLAAVDTFATKKGAVHKFTINKNDSNNSDSFPTDINIRISDSLDYIDLSTLFRQIDLNVRCKIQGGKNLRHLYLVDDGIRDVQYSIEGLPNLRTLNVSYNKPSSLPPDFFSAFSVLEVLSLLSCQLSSEFMSRFSSRLFVNLTNLRVLDLSFNSLDSLAPGTFSTNTNLTSLNLAGNRFRKIPFELMLTPNLTFLDVRLNALSSIGGHEREAMDRQVKRFGKFQLAMSGNTLSCGCENLPFLQWLQDTKVELDDQRNYTCLNDKGMTSNTLLFEDLSGLWRKCWGQTFFNLSLSLFCLTLVGFLSVFIWTKSKTLIISGVLQIFTGFKLKTLSDYQYGVFIGYADKDYQFACFSLRLFVENDLGLSTFVRDRDLLLSTVFAQGIMEAINSSWRIVLVVNQSFADQNDWFLYTIRSAVYSVSPANPSRVVILVHHTCIDQLPLELLNSVPEDNVIVVKHWEMTYELKQTIRTRIV